MTFLILALLFFTAGVVSILFQRIVPDAEVLRKRFPNRPTFTGIVLWAVMIVAVWIIVTHTSGFTRIASITTMLFFLLIFESIFLLAVRFVKLNILAALLSLGIALVPFVVQYYAPTFFLMNAVIIIATMGATTIVIKLGYVSTRAILILSVVFAITDVLNVAFLIPHLHLVPVTEPVRLLIFPTVTVGKHVVGSGDFMFLVFTTLGLLKKFGTRPAVMLVAAESVALFITGIIVAQKDIIFPFLTVMTPVFLAVYAFASFRVRRQHKTAALETQTTP